MIGRGQIGAGARVGTRALLMPGASIGAGAEIEPGTMVTGEIPAGQRWAGSPAQQIGQAGDGWPAPLATPTGRGVCGEGACTPPGSWSRASLPLLASLPGIVVLSAFAPGTLERGHDRVDDAAARSVLALSFVRQRMRYSIALAVRAVSPLVKARLAPRRRHGGLGAVAHRVADGQARAASCSRCTRASTRGRGCGCSASRSASAPRSRPRSGSTG